MIMTEADRRYLGQLKPGMWYSTRELSRITHISNDRLMTLANHGYVRSMRIFVTPFGYWRVFIDSDDMIRYLEGHGF